MTKEQPVKNPVTEEIDATIIAALQVQFPGAC